MKAYEREPVAQTYQQLNEKKAVLNKDLRDGVYKDHAGGLHDRMRTITDKGSLEDMSSTVQNEGNDTAAQMSINTAEPESASLGKRSSIVHAIHQDIQSLDTFTIGNKSLGS